MKKKYLLLPFILPLLSYSQDILWEKSYGGQHADYLFDAQPTADYGFILAGSSLSNKTGNKTDDNRGDLDYWIWKMNEKGDLDWQKSIGGNGFDLLQSIKNTKDGGFILAGTSSSSISFQKKEDCKGITDFWVIKLDASGAEQWQRTIGGSGQDELLCAFQTKDGGYMLGGSSSSNPPIISNIKPEGKSIVTTKADLYNKTEKSRGNMDYWIIKINDTGEIQWQNTYGAEGDDQPYVIHQTSDGGYVVGGNSNSKNALTSLGGIVSNGTDYWILKLDEEGGVLWSKTYDFGKVDILTSLVENKDQSYLIGGYAQTESKVPREGIVGKAVGLVAKEKDGINDYIALKIDDKGEELWSKTVGSGGEDILRKLVETRDGGYLMAGTSNSSASKDKNGSIGGNDFWVVKLKDKTKIEKVKSSIEAIPNPATTYTNVIIGYDFKEGTATLVDITGRILQEFTISSRTVPVNLSRYSEGIYIISIKTDVKTESVKVIKLVK